MTNTKEKWTLGSGKTKQWNIKYAVNFVPEKKLCEGFLAVIKVVSKNKKNIHLLLLMPDNKKKKKGKIWVQILRNFCFSVFLGPKMSHSLKIQTVTFSHF